MQSSHRRPRAIKARSLTTPPHWTVLRIGVCRFQNCPEIGTLNELLDPFVDLGLDCTSNLVTVDNMCVHPGFVVDLKGEPNSNFGHAEG